MSREIVLPAWLSALSLAVALFVPLGVSLIADTSLDEGRARTAVSPDAPVAQPQLERGEPRG